MLFDQRYIGMVREENTLNILLQFVPGGSIRSLRGRLLSFPEAVSITYSACTITLMYFDELTSEEYFLIQFISLSGHQKIY